MDLDEILAALNGMTPEQIAAESANADKLVGRRKFVPTLGPQTAAYFSEADVLLFGGSPGGGKTALECGLALNEHKRSLIVRRNFVDLDGVLHTLTNILGNSEGLTGGNRPKYETEDCLIHFMGAGEDIGGKQGNPHDLICVDEAAQLPEQQVRMLLGWLRTNVPGQRCRMVLASNPPLDSTGDWMLEFFGPWLDPRHPNPAQEGELRYFLPNENGSGYRECSPDERTEIQGVEVPPQSRTYISSSFKDNPYYDHEQYARSLAGLPDEVRDRLVTGNFLLSRGDDVWQTIPTAWIRAAQERWTQHPPAGVPMCAIGVDIAQGGADNTVLAIRHDGWFAPMITEPGSKTPDGKTAAGVVMSKRRDGAKVVVDIGGGWGGDCYAHLRENGIDSVSYMGVKPSGSRTADRQLKFFNTRSAAYWRFREALDPSQPGGSPIMLPPDSVLVADLCAPTYEITPNGIKVESKEKVVDKLKRSPDRGDAVIMAWHGGLKQANVPGGFVERTRRMAKPTVVMGHAPTRRRA
jgi:hypothetical protein